ncbi:MAG: signal peptidase I [Lachnospiraceae bacterium]|nr:signal peptidase I [Lachnospiraceae bacterium]
MISGFRKNLTGEKGILAEKKSAGKNRTTVKTTAKRHRKKQNPTVKGLIDGSVFVLVVLVCTFLVLTFVTQRTRVTGTSMETTLYDGDNIMMDKLSYRFRPVRRNEVICFVSKRDNETLIKRVIGLPGETVRINSGTIYINDEPINDYIGGISFAGRAEDGITLEKNEYFVLGDNRMDSIDSRYEEVGNVRKEDILGRAFLLFYPFQRIRVVK